MKVAKGWKKERLECGVMSLILPAISFFTCESRKPTHRRRSPNPEFECCNMTPQPSRTYIQVSSHLTYLSPSHHSMIKYHHHDGHDGYTTSLFRLSLPSSAPIASAITPVAQ